MGEIGEKIIGYELLKRGWEVHLNFSTGYDLYISKNKVHRNIEVKTRDPYKKTGETKKRINFFVTKKEMEKCDFVICYLHGMNTYLIIRKTEIPIMDNKKGRISIFLTKNKEVGGMWKKFVDNWEVLE